MTKISRRRKLNKKRFISFILGTIVVIMVMPVLFQSAASGGTEVKYNTITVENGDNLWNIANKYTPKGKDVRLTIEKIKDFNGMAKSSLSMGQEIKIPSSI